MCTDANSLNNYIGEVATLAHTAISSTFVAVRKLALACLAGIVAKEVTLLTLQADIDGLATGTAGEDHVAGQA